MIEYFTKLMDLAHRRNSVAYVKYLRKKGCHIGKNTHFFSPLSTTVDETRPYLVSIGDYCKITSGVIILTHDYSRSVLRVKYKEIIGEAGKTTIGNNVFIGINTIIFKGVTIGNNVIIGAGSVVVNDVPDDTVAAGNPAMVITTLDEYYQKRKGLYIDEAKELAREIFRKTGRKPTVTELDGFHPLFLKRDMKEIKKYHLRMKLSGDDYEDVVKSFLASKPLYANFEEFLKDCGIQ